MSIEQHTNGFDRLRWFKSSYSGSGGGDCVEVAVATGLVRVRDSKDVSNTDFKIPARSWGAFITFVAAHQVDLSTASLG